MGHPFIVTNWQLAGVDILWALVGPLGFTQVTYSQKITITLYDYSANLNHCTKAMDNGGVWGML